VILLMMVDTPEEKRKFVILYENYRYLMLKVAVDILHDYQLAEDAMQEAFVRVAKHMENVGQPEETATKRYLITITKHAAIDLYRRRNRLQSREIYMDELPEETTEEELLALIQKLNDNPDVHGILCQLPLPKHICEDHVIQAIDPQKDVDGFHPQNVGALVVGKKGFVSCTPAGIIQLLKRSNIEIAGKHCVVIGRSNIVGKPMALLMLRENATVTICHSRTENLKGICKEADILIVAIGKPRYIGADYIKEGAVVIDVGIHRNEENKLCGDVRFEEAEQIASYITPVPGGVGPMTIAMLMHNCVDAMKLYS